MKTISNASEITIPDRFTCPICGAAIYVEDVDAWEEDGSGEWKAEAVKIDCTTFPGFEDEEAFSDYMRGHWSMPYVDWLPLERIVTEWVNSNYKWEM